MINKSNERIWSIDILKIVCALLIFCRHAITMAGRTFYTFNTFILNSTSPVMTLFFLISGMTICDRYLNQDLGNGKEIINFYLKRLITVVPAYYFVNILAMLVGNFDLRKALYLQPVELFGIQSWYQTLFGIFHNGGTWFVSCILFCYFIYPLMNQILKFASKQVCIIILGILLFIDAYSLFVIGIFHLGSTYSSPLFRMLEFMMGVCLGKLRFAKENNIFNKQTFNIVVFLIMLMILVGLLTNFITVKWILYLRTTILCVFTISLSKITINPQRIMKNVISSIVGICYDIYLVQIIIWAPYGWCIDTFPVIISHNVYALLLAFFIMIVLSIAIHYAVEKPIQSFLRNKLIISKT